MPFNDTKKKSNLQLKRGIFSSLRVSNRTQRRSVDGLFESQSSLYSTNSFSPDDFNWSLQPSYLKMMNDTNLMDNCAEAQEEIESVRVNVSKKHLQFLDTNKSKTHRSTVDPEQMLKWIVYMEEYLKTISPNWREVNQMDEDERCATFKKQHDLRQFIASYTRNFNQMIKEEDTPYTRNVQEKFHLLLLNAIEKQCLLEGYPNPEVEDDYPHSFDRPDLNLDVYKLCSLDIEPQSNLDRLDYTLNGSTESLGSDGDTITTSDDGINFPTHPTTSKSSIFSDDHCSPFSSHSDFPHQQQNESLENILKEFDDIIDLESPLEEFSTEELQNSHKNSSSSISACTLKLIENVDSMLPKISTPNIEEYLDTNHKVDDWLCSHPNETTKHQLGPDLDKKIVQKIGLSSSSGSDLGSGLSIQWDNFQDVYTLTAPMHEEVNKDYFLYFGDDYDDALKGKRTGSMSSISDIVRERKSSLKSSTSALTASSTSELSWPKCYNNKIETIERRKIKIASRKRKRVPREVNTKEDVVNQQSSPSDSSKMAKDILLIAEDLRSNYKNLKPQDFDGILRVCRENLGCLIVVLDKEQQHHRSNQSMDGSVGDDRIYIQENCQCGVIGKFVGRVVRFLYECSRSVRRSPTYRFLLRTLKYFYALVKFLSHKIRVYRSLYGNY